MDFAHSSVTALRSVNALWTVKIERLAIRLAVGIYPEELAPQPLWVSLTLESQAPLRPDELQDCIDYEPLHNWLTQHWPRTPHTPLLETRINELIEYSFNLDARVSSVRVGLFKKRVSRNAIAVGIERGATRAEFELQRQQSGAAASYTASLHRPVVDTDAEAATAVARRIPVQADS